MLIPPIDDPRSTQHAVKDSEGLPQAVPTAGSRLAAPKLPVCCRHLGPGGPGGRLQT